jgi:hypothetical protein
MSDKINLCTLCFDKEQLSEMLMKDNSSLIYIEITEQLIKFLNNLHLQDKYIIDSLLKLNIEEVFIFICETFLIKLVDLLVENIGIFMIMLLKILF